LNTYLATYTYGGVIYAALYDEITISSSSFDDVEATYGSFIYS